MTTPDSTYSYDLVPYPRLAFVHTHPDRLASLAILLGLTPPPVAHARVLEIGCGSGANLLAMAMSLPRSRLVGIDLSARQIAIGNDDVARMGISNLTLLHRNLMDVEDELGQFDYIIAHGVYSWVAPPVRDRLMALCKRHLAVNGVAYISYNVYPGWHGIEAMRHMMRYHVREIMDSHRRAVMARGLMDFLAASLSREENLYGAFLNMHNDFLKKELDEGLPENDAYLLHEHLEDVNDPVYFHEFADHIERHGLQYLCDAEFRTDLPTNLPAPVVEKLMVMVHNLTELEQYMDFLRNRMFRRTLLCHEDAPINRTLSGDRLRPLYLAAPALPENPQPDLPNVAVERFIAQDGAKLAIDHPLSKAAMVALSRCWPEFRSFDDLAKEGWELLDQGGKGATRPIPERDYEVLAINLLRAFTYSENLVELHSTPTYFSAKVSGTPTASPWARLQSESSSRVTNLRQEPIKVDEFERALLRLLDGTRQPAAILEELRQALAAGKVTLASEAGKQSLEALFATKLERLARSALLMA
jgi:methyltransferase-like protein/predicted TPR repeat methyltransferase